MNLSLRSLFTRWFPALVIAALTVADGVLHLRLDYLLFGGTVWGTPHQGRPPAGAPTSGFSSTPGSPGAAGSPGAPRAGGPPRGFHPPSNPFPFPLNEMFFLNFLAALGLALAYLVFSRWFHRWLWLVDLAIVAFAATTLWGWQHFGKPNPQNLGHIGLVLDVALLILPALHGLALLFSGRRGERSTASSFHGPARAR